MAQDNKHKQIAPQGGRGEAGLVPLPADDGREAPWSWRNPWAGPCGALIGIGAAVVAAGIVAAILFWPASQAPPAASARPQPQAAAPPKPAPAKAAGPASRAASAPAVEQAAPRVVVTAPPPATPPPPAPPEAPKDNPKTRYLREQIGGVVEVAAANQPKKPMQVFLEKLVEADDRANAPGHWIDELPDSRPTKPPILPKLSAQTLYQDKVAANAHWDDFRKRNPKTAAYLAKHIVRPTVRTVPGDNIQKFIGDCVENFRRVYHANDEAFFGALGETLLYADFLLARGDQTAQTNGYMVAGSAQSALEYFLVEHAQDNVLAGHYVEEILWPAMDSDHGRFSEGAVAFAMSILQNVKGKDSRSYLQLQKWAVSHTPCSANFKRLMLVERSNTYGHLNDPIGVVLTLHAAIAHGAMGEPTLNCIRSCLIEKFGPDSGSTLYRQYLELAYNETKQAVVLKVIKNEHALGNAGEQDATPGSTPADAPGADTSPKNAKHKTRSSTKRSNTGRAP